MNERIPESYKIRFYGGVSTLLDGLEIHPAETGSRGITMSGKKDDINNQMPDLKRVDEHESPIEVLGGF